MAAQSGIEPDTATLRCTPLYGAHVAAGARMVPFAGYEMPLQYAGIMAEHRATRAHAGLFDVSHMGQADITGDTAVSLLERLTPADIEGLRVGHARYTVLLNAAGGMVDDLIVTRLPGRLRIVVNGARREAVAAHFAAHAQAGAAVRFLDAALIALQGPAAGRGARTPHLGRPVRPHLHDRGRGRGVRRQNLDRALRVHRRRRF